MMKYLSVFKISFQQEFAYRLNFILWRLRNVIQIFIIFFLWDTVFTNPNQEIFGYNRDKILTYVFGILILRSIVLSTRAIDISGEISRGDIMNYLVKPVNYFNYWFTRDISSKALNLMFAVFEAVILFFILKPPFYVQTDPILLFLFIISVVVAILLFFHLLLIVNMIAFWAPESGWAGQYLFVYIFTEALSGAIFPIDILPSGLQQIVYSLPFPYLLFFPLQVYLGKLPLDTTIAGLGVAIVWTTALFFASRFVWNRGIKQYVTYGK